MDSATSAPAPAAHTKQYVFVDEYNRHKRLKVMRACDGCRKRKIRCDGALQNGPWPCGACIRLKLKCVPPTLDQDDDCQTPDSATGQQTFSFQNTTFPKTSPAATKPNGSSSQPRMVHEWTNNVPPTTPTSAPAYQPEYSSNAYSHQPNTRPTQQGYHQGNFYAGTSTPLQYPQSGGQMPSFIRSGTEVSEASSGDAQEIEAGVRELSSAMGDLQIDITSAAPYITRAQLAPDAPGMDEVEVVLPASVLADSTIRIPPEMMPSDERATYFFNYFFDHIHPYCPVLHRATFLEKWRTDRHSMSPLLLEAIFACVARYLEQPVESRKWLALASRHEESFKDVPRLDTIQAMIILMKARESISKRGYYYRSWMAVKYMTTSAIDLGLDIHHEQHRSTNKCNHNRTECMLRTRIWQTLFTLEILTGAPMGRSDFSVDIDSVQYAVPTPTNDIDAFEHLASRRSTILAQAVRNIKQSNILWQTMKRYKKDWALDPSFVQHNEDLPIWADNLPNDFQLQYSDDGSPPWLGADHYKAYVHVYHHLTIIMHHRPQLQALLAKGDPGWKDQLEICLNSAMLMCRIQEALYRDFQFHGLQFMIRGVNFTIYCVLTCMMLHLAAITCPDPKLNTQARIYFTRHMRVLEHCITSANAEMQAQINTLREAFSADVTQPFELKPTLGLRSPVMENHSTPSSTNSDPTNARVLTQPTWNMADAANSKSMSASVNYATAFDGGASHGLSARPSMTHHDGNYDLSQTSPYGPPAMHQVSAAQTGYALEPVISNEQHTPVWDPSGIFNQWNAAFGGGAPPQATPPGPGGMQHTSAPIMQNQTSPISTHAMYGAQQIPVSNPVIPDTSPPAMPMVTPVMWQDAFTSAYVSGHGQKRYREASVDHSAYAHYATSKRRG
ncbi:hypothetical protein CKM354_000651000 [Cercospora kikuchii]|uniref:Zn(2)-C6 fungal-type domain-containing protein n=1 Tax=Cercospora kikuchii TaxID=84275 RepID=A0A9P3FDH1_9PEZI|nr:uncharacterized protein CKM354_000651000 [Cercospora kikuchii]GIZ43278.1 hypothetical protein CKM354_000651000 [Cercospora kikuchii]